MAHFIDHDAQYGQTESGYEICDACELWRKHDLEKIFDGLRNKRSLPINVGRLNWGEFVFADKEKLA